MIYYIVASNYCFKVIFPLKFPNFYIIKAILFFSYKILLERRWTYIQTNIIVLFQQMIHKIFP